MLSKSRGQVLRLAPILHLLFSIDSESEQSQFNLESEELEQLQSDVTEVSEVAIKAAINFVKLAGMIVCRIR